MAVTKRQYETLASWRLALRRFLRFSQEAAHAAGVPPQQHQALLAIKGKEGGDHCSVGEIAAALHLKHHSAVGLIDRLAKRGLVERARSVDDRRKMHVRLTPAGEKLLEALSVAHLRELKQFRRELKRLLQLVEEA